MYVYTPIFNTGLLHEHIALEPSNLYTYKLYIPMKQLDWEPGCFWAEAFQKFVSSIIISENDEYEILLELIPLYLVISS